MAIVYFPYEYKDEKIYLQRVIRVPFTKKIIFRFSKKQIEPRSGYQGMMFRIKTRYFGGSFVVFCEEKQSKVFVFRPFKRYIETALF